MKEFSLLNKTGVISNILSNIRTEESLVIEEGEKYPAKLFSDGETKSLLFCSDEVGIWIDVANGGGTTIEFFEAKFVAEALDELITELMLLSWL